MDVASRKLSGPNAGKGGTVLFRQLVMAAFLVACMALAPADGAAQQQRAPERPTVGGGQTAAPLAGSAAPQAQPSGLRRAFGGKAPPAVLQRVFPGLFGSPVPTPEVPTTPDVGVTPTPEPEPEPCGTSIQFVGGQFLLVDCNGNVVSP